MAFDALGVAGLGFLLGLQHATDADHVVAVTTIVAREPSVRRAAWIGGVWGVGHSLTLLVLGGAMIGFRLAMPPRIGLSLELMVAAMLVLLGVRNLRAAPPDRAADAGAAGGGPRAGLRRPLLVGVVHGLAGSAAVAVLVLSTIATVAGAVAYLLVFGLGTVVGMMLVTMVIAAPALLAGARIVRLQRGIRMAAGALSVVVGLVLADTILRGGGLLGAAPRWTPH